MSLGDATVEVGAETGERFLLRAEQDIAIFEAQTLGFSIEFHAHGHILGLDIGVAPIIQDHGIDEQSQKEIDQHATDHDEQSLPSRFGAEFPGLWRLLHLFGVHRLIDHAGYFAVAAEGQPPYAIFCVTLLGFPAEEFSRPLADAQVEENEKFVHLYPK